MEKKKFDVVVLGAGPGGYPAAIRAAQRGKTVALIEAKEVGGTCLNRGCIPSKALISSGEAWVRFHAAKELGISAKGLSFDYGQMASRKDQVVSRMKKGLEGLIAANKITIFRGYGRFVAPDEIKVLGQDNDWIVADKIIVATGSEPRQIAAFPFDYERIHDSTSLLALTELPKSIVIIGGGVIGCEFASLYANLGVEVTVLEMLPRLLPMEAKDVSAALTRSFEKKGIKVQTGAKVEGIDLTKKGIEVRLAGSPAIQGDIALVAVGRALNTNNIGLEKAGVAVLDNGLIPVNAQMETSVAGIYAVGDIASRWWLAHVATHQGVIAADNACGYPATMHYNAVPSVIFTHPEIGTVGLSLEAALEQGYKAKVGAFPFQALGKAQASLETEGFAQIVVEEKTGRILGAQVVGFEASTLVAEMAVAIANELTVESITDTIHAHPTYAEAWLEAAFIAEGMPLHLPPKKR